MYRLFAPVMAACMLVVHALAVAQVPSLSLGQAAVLDRGRALYLGAQPFAAPVRMGSVEMPPAALARGCAACHGFKGEGGREAGIVVPPVQWHRLQQPSAGHRAFEGAQPVLEAIGRGVGREGQALRAPMPQFALNASEQDALLAYLRVLGTDAQPQPGVAADRVVLGTVLPLTGAQAAVGERIRATLAAGVQEVNSRGGLFGRRLELRVLDAGATAASAAKVAREVIASQEVFALVASLVPEPDSALLQAVTTHGVPMVATLGVPAVQTGTRGVSYLLPSLEVQIASLANELNRQCAPGSGVGSGNGSTAQDTLVLHYGAGMVGQKFSANTPKHMQARQVNDRAALAAEIAKLPLSRVIALLPAAWVDDVRQILSATRRDSCLGTLAVTSGLQPPSAQGVLAELIALPMPAVRQQIGVTSSDTLWTLLAQVGLNTMMEALSRSGRQLDSIGLLDAIDTLNQFEAVPNVTLSFSPGKHHGFDTTYVWKERNHATLSTRTP
jgi:mono/diheme cytochrome c family protein